MIIVDGAAVKFQIWDTAGGKSLLDEFGIGV